MRLNYYTPDNNAAPKLATLLNQHRLERGLGALNADKTALPQYWVFAHQRAHEVHLENLNATTGGLAAEMSAFGFRFKTVQELRVVGANSAEAAFKQVLADERLEGQLLGQSAGAMAVGYCQQASIFSVLLFEPVNTVIATVSVDGDPLARTEVRVNGTAYQTDGDGRFEIA